MSGCRQHAQLSVEDVIENLECVTVVEGPMQNVDRLLPRIEKNLVGAAPLVQFGLRCEQLTEWAIETCGRLPVKTERLPCVQVVCESCRPEALLR